MGKLYKNFVFDIIAAAVCLSLGIVMLPPIGIGGYIVRILLALVLAAYLALFLFDKIRKTRGTAFILSIIEFVVVLLLILDLILEQFNVFTLSGVCHTLGLVLALRGIMSSITMYISAYYSKKKRKNLPIFLLSLFFIALGVFLFAKPILSDLVINWVLCSLFFLCFLIYGALALLFAPDRKTKKKLPASKKEDA